MPKRYAATVRISAQLQNVAATQGQLAMENSRLALIAPITKTEQLPIVDGRTPNCAPANTSRRKR
jgi:hypothetical protein